MFKTFDTAKLGSVFNSIKDFYMQKSSSSGDDEKNEKERETTRFSGEKNEIDFSRFYLLYGMVSPNLLPISLQVFLSLRNSWPHSL